MSWTLASFPRDTWRYTSVNNLVWSWAACFWAYSWGIFLLVPFKYRCPETWRLTSELKHQWTVWLRNIHCYVWFYKFVCCLFCLVPSQRPKKKEDDQQNPSMLPWVFGAELLPDHSSLGNPFLSCLHHFVEWGTPKQNRIFREGFKNFWGPAS